MDETPSQIERQMSTQRSQLGQNLQELQSKVGQNLHELQSKVEEVTDWRSQFQKRPMAILGVAFGGGVLLASMTGGRSRSNRHYASSSDLSAHNQATQAQKSKALDQFDAMKGAIIGMAANTFQNFIGELVPGFQQQLEQTKRDKQSSPATSVPQRSAATVG